MSKTVNPHDGHRGRLKERYIKSEGVGFSDHELLELLLFYAIPRVNTNEIAHRLINTFGSLTAVSEAGVEELMQVDGIGERSAVLVHTAMALVKDYIGNLKMLPYRIDTLDKAVAFARELAKGADADNFYAAFLDPSLRVIAVRFISKSPLESVDEFVSEIIVLCLRYRAVAVLIMQNRIDRDVVPTKDDLALMRAVEQGLEYINASLTESIIVNGKAHFALKGFFMNKTANFTDLSMQSLKYRLFLMEFDEGIRALERSHEKFNRQDIKQLKY